MKLVFASNNKHKIEEVSAILGSFCTIISLKELGCDDEIPETQPTIEGNALQKARYIHEKYKVNCFADDTGLEIDALHGDPGVYSARFAGEGCSFRDNMEKVLRLMEHEDNRKAVFKTVIALILDGTEYLFEGKVTGKITLTEMGEKGFGYDPIFLPDGYSLTYAEMDLHEKNKLSHRARATAKMKEFFDTNPQLKE